MNKKKTRINLLLQKYPAITSDKWRIKALSGASGGSFYAEATANIKLIALFSGKDHRLLGIKRQKKRKILHQLTQFIPVPKVQGANNYWLLLEWMEGKAVTDSTCSLVELYS